MELTVKQAQKLLYDVCLHLKYDLPRIDFLDNGDKKVEQSAWLCRSDGEQIASFTTSETEFKGHWSTDFEKLLRFNNELEVQAAQFISSRIDLIRAN